MNKQTPLQSIKKYCHWCQAGDNKEVTNCLSKNECVLYPFRKGHGKKGISPLKSIRKKCINCSENFMDIKNCDSEDCQLWIFRFGKNPNRKGHGGGFQKGHISQKKACHEPVD